MGVFRGRIKTGHAAAGDSVVGATGNIDLIVGTDGVFEGAVHILAELAEVAWIGGGGDAFGLGLRIPGLLRVVNGPVTAAVATHVDFVFMAYDVVYLAAAPTHLAQVDEFARLGVKAEDVH